MYYIRKYSDCFALHDDDSGASRPLNSDEIVALTREFPELANEEVGTVFTDTVSSIVVNLPPGPKLSWNQRTYF